MRKDDLPATVTVPSGATTSSVQSRVRFIRKPLPVPGAGGPFARTTDRGIATPAACMSAPKSRVCFLSSCSGDRRLLLEPSICAVRGETASAGATALGSFSPALTHCASCAPFASASATGTTEL